MGDDEAEMNVRVRIVVVALTRGWMDGRELPSYP
jgi:hypothetical protein